MERVRQLRDGYGLFRAAAVVVMVSVIACYLLLHSDLSARMKHVNTLESDVMNLKNENDAVQKKINTSVDLETIRKKAMEELGMVYPSEGQIKYFDVDTEDYMNQYEDIPER